MSIADWRPPLFIIYKRWLSPLISNMNQAMSSHSIHGGEIEKTTTHIMFLWRETEGFFVQQKAIVQSFVYTATAIPSIYTFSGNSAASALISTFMCLWAIYIFPGSVHIFPPAEKADRTREYISHSQTHECGNWDWGRAIPFLVIFVSNFRYCVFAVYTIH
jgi:hypothetical protein